jgi:hypothetical protein
VVGGRGQPVGDIGVRRRGGISSKAGFAWLRALDWEIQSAREMMLNVNC